MLEPITDYITGKEIDNVGAEASRQIFEKYLVETLGYDKSRIQVDVPLTVQFKGEDYHSVIDLLVWCNERPFMAVTCVAGSIGSYEREILAGARLVYETQVPFAVTTDARDAILMDTLTGETIGQGLSALPSSTRAEELMSGLKEIPLAPEKRSGEMIIYRSFNLEKINK
jgi:hypothetical protein